ncbi:MAG: type II toxin-antitoxin system ParD family antitoxin [Pseudomonadota bacterium]|nr:type II toxin-antitoxin system ParD family antitoxin [Pseudomonadota bacterium]
MPSSYALGERYEKMMEDLIASGRFNSKSEVLRHGLRMVEESEARYLTELEELREAVRIGMESGPGIPAEEVRARLKARIREIAARSKSS